MRPKQEDMKQEIKEDVKQEIKEDVKQEIKEENKLREENKKIKENTVFNYDFGEKEASNINAELLNQKKIKEIKQELHEEMVERIDKVEIKMVKELEKQINDFLSK
jgi:aspartate/tyrosine/aromatic aminotransferase